MAPLRYAGCFTDRRFPRPRGDGPDKIDAAVWQQRVPPPTRGWPFIRGCRNQSLLGSPAHAGMALYPWMQEPVITWFPRPRGDGPGTEHRNFAHREVPPPTRGWPLLAGCRLRGPEGSPAHAGMAPARDRRDCGADGFPRPRGDGPAALTGAMPRLQVPPPTRGWPPQTDSRDARSPGSPAHAGMAPRHGHGDQAATRFPRPRGDGPACRPMHRPCTMVPPPTRGWPPRLATGAGPVLCSTRHHGIGALGATIFYPTGHERSSDHCRPPRQTSRA